jgi:MscS family membrane protein
MMKITCFLLFLVMLWPAMVSADAVSEMMGPPAQGSSTSPAEPKVVDIAGYRSPRETLQTFFAAMDKAKTGDVEQLNSAINTLDLSEVNVLIRPEVGRDLVWTLYEVIYRSGGIKSKRVSAVADAKSPYLLKQLESGAIQMTRDIHGRWSFDRNTIETLPAMLDEASKNKAATDKKLDDSHLPWHLKIRNQLPEWLKDNSFFLEIWQWIGILLTITLGSLADRLLSFLLRIGMRVWSRWHTGENTHSRPDDWLRPFGLMAMAGVWWLCLNMLGLPEEWLVILLVAVKVLVGIAGIWAGWRVVDLFSDILHVKAHATANKLDDVLVPLLRKVIKSLVVLIGIIFILSNLNMNVTGLFAGLGLGGLAFALAAKDTIQNLFGSISVLLDQSFHVGDWVVIEDVEGTVEEVGLRSTRIRTFYDSQVVVPNSRLITATIDNMGKRHYRRLKLTLTVTYDTSSDKLEEFCEGIRELIRINDYTRKDYYHVYFHEMADSYLGILVYMFFSTPDWGSELRERHQFLLNVMRLAETMGVQFAFPSRTVVVKRGADTVLPDELDRPQGKEAIWQQARTLARQTMDASSGK